MSKADLIVLSIVLIVAGFAFYEGFIHHRKDACHGCPYAKNCNGGCRKGKKQKTDL